MVWAPAEVVPELWCQQKCLCDVLLNEAEASLYLW